MLRFRAALWFAAITLAMGASVTGAAHANLVVNGGFEQVTMPNGPAQMNTSNVAGWSTTGYNFVLFPGNPTSFGSYGKMSLWAPSTGSANGFTAVSPAGGNFVAADGAFQVGAITQTIKGLSVGQTYAVSFDWAAAQQATFNGPTTEAWQVSLGGQSFETPIFDNPNHGFSGWIRQTFNYKATSASEVLSFLAVGTPGGEPPFSLLDGVTATAVPEPATWAILAAGLAGAGAFGFRYRKGCDITG